MSFLELLKYVSDPFRGSRWGAKYDIGGRAKKKLVTFHEQKPIDYLITKTYTVTNIKQIIKICNM